MNYIDKSTKSIAGDALIDDFLNETKRVGNSPLYFLFAGTPLKNDLRDILIDAQRGYCCYCMRTLSKDSSTTLEHVIPKGVNITEAKEYLDDYPGSFLNVVHIDDYMRTNTYPPYPHTVAYNNLLASCKGLLTSDSDSCLCCNNKRGHKKIMPLPLIPGIETAIKYAPSGQMYAGDNDGQKDHAISVLNLNNRTLKDIRGLWCYIRKKGLNVASKDDLLKAFDDNILHMPDSFRQYYINEYYFSLFLSYKWFHEYYS